MNYTKILSEAASELPCAFVDLEAFDANVRTIANQVAGTPFTIRIATKSLRVPELIRRVLNSGAPYKGLMCYSARELEFLAGQGFDDLMLAYPTLQPSDLAALKRVHESGKLVTMVVDDERQLQILENAFAGVTRPFPLLIEPDLSLRLGSLVIGVRRSPVRTADEVRALALKIRNYDNLAFHGIMAYEAQVAGVPDRNPFKKLLSPALRFIRRFSMKKIIQKRAEILRLLSDAGIRPQLFNGGGTGSLSFNRDEASVLTEVTAGSGFYCPHLFSYYTNFELKPAAFFALQVVRSAEPGWYTCLGGGYIASGEPGWDRVPVPARENQGLSPFEATGEVQTPVSSPVPLELGAPVIFRHAKAGELAERFDEFLLLEQGKVSGRTKTYRGLGQNYL